MKMIRLHLVLAFLQLQVAHAEPKKVGDLMNVNEAVSMLFVKETPLKDGGWEYVPIGEKFNIEAKDRKALENLKHVALVEQNDPLFGPLGNVALINKKGDVISVIAVVELSATFRIKEVGLEEKKIILLPDGYYEEGSSIDFARWMYACMSAKWPDEMKQREKQWEKQWLSDNDKSILGVIGWLKNNPVNKGGADQPATAPELKSGDDEKPNPESEVRPQ